MAPSAIDISDADECIKQNTTYKPTTKLKLAIKRAETDFRSDTVTVPTENMIQAIIDATFNDDLYDEEGDASVNALQDKLAEMTGMEAGLWSMSGTMGNQICLRTHLQQPPHTVLLDHRAHIQCWESGALPVFSQASVTGVHPANSIHLTVEDVKKHMIADGSIYFPPTRVVALENTLSGTILPLKDAQEISAFVRNYPTPEGVPPIAMHLDAARIFDGVVGEGVDLKDYCACFDSMSICLSKGVGAPMGSVILGSKKFIRRAKVFRKMFGGGTRQPGMMAAAASAALDHSLPLLPFVHDLARRTAQALSNLGYQFLLPVQTNMIVLDMDASGIPPAAYVDYCRSEDILFFPTGRIVFHHQTSEDGARKLIKVLERLMADKKAGVKFEDRKITGGYAL